MAIGDGVQFYGVSRKGSHSGGVPLAKVHVCPVVESMLLPHPGSLRRGGQGLAQVHLLRKGWG